MDSGQWASGMNCTSNLELRTSDPVPARLVPRAQSAWRQQRGISLIELLVGVTVSTTVVLAGYTLMSNSDKASTVNDQTAEMQLNARVAMELITKDLKQAGFGMVGPIGACTNAIVPADNNSAGADTGPDSVSVVVPTLLSTLAVQAPGASPTTLTLQPGSVAAMTPSGFGVGATISAGGAWTTTVSNITGDVLTLGISVAQTATFPAGTQVFWLQCVTYAVSTNATTCSSKGPCLLRGGVPLADGIEDLQIAYACDGCLGAAVDGAVDDQNASGTFDSADFVSNNTWATSPMTPDTIRLARITIVARQVTSDIQWNATVPVVAEDHNPGTDPGFNQSTYKQVRRRLYTKTVQVRNLGL